MTPDSPLKDARLVVGIADTLYRVERPWGEPPGDEPIGMWAGVGCDGAGQVYVFQRFDRLADAERGSAVLVYRPDGRFRHSWGRDLIKDAHHLTVDAQGRLLMVDRDAHQVIICNDVGEVLLCLGERDRPGQPFNHPTSATVGPDGSIYVADGYGATSVHRFDPDGRLLRSWGGFGKGPGAFSTPHGIGCFSDGRILVGDRENDRVQIFSPEGDYLAEFSGPYHPMSIYVDANDIAYISDQTPRLIAIDSKLELVGMCRHVLNGGHGMAGSPEGDLYFSESRPNRLTKLLRIA